MNGHAVPQNLLYFREFFCFKTRFNHYPSPSALFLYSAATLGLAIYAKRHGDVWDAAAALLRDHASSLSPHRMQSLLENLVAAASQMTPAEKARPGRGPPPLLLVWGPRPLPTTLQPVRLVVDPSAVPQSPAGRQGLFLYDPFAAKRKLEKAGSGDPASESEAGTVTEWVCGEMAVVDIEVSNPSSVSIKIDKMVLEAELNGVPATKVRPCISVLRYTLSYNPPNYYTVAVI